MMEVKWRDSGAMEPIDGVISELFRRGTLHKSAAFSEIWGRWKEIAGDDIAEHCFPEKIDNKKLYVKVESPVWRQQLDLMKEELIEKIDRSLGNTEIERIIFR